MDTVFNRPLSRRRLLGAGALAAAGVPLHAACGGGDSGGTGSAGNKTVRLGVIKTWITPEIQAIIDQFQTASGQKVKLVPIAGSSGVELIQQFTPGLVSGKPSVDVMFISDEATPGFVSAGWL